MFAVATLLAGCAAGGANPKSRPGSSQAGTVPTGGLVTRPNVVFVLTDDLSNNLVPYMPHLRAMMRRGARFTHYFVTDSLCCPSRASIFTGLYPHSSGVFTNGGTDGGMWTFNRHGNARRTYAVALQRRGYRTALMGKYLNEYEPNLQFHVSRPYVPEGWNDWAVAGNRGYREFNYELNQNGRLDSYGSGSRAISHQRALPARAEVHRAHGGALRRLAPAVRARGRDLHTARALRARAS